MKNITVATTISRYIILVYMVHGINKIMKYTTILLSSALSLIMFGCGGSSDNPAPEVIPPPEVTPPDHCSAKNLYTTSEGSSSKSVKFVEVANSIRYVNYCNELVHVSWDISQNGNERVYEIYYNLNGLGETAIYASNFLTIKPYYDLGEMYKVTGWTTPSNPDVDEDGNLNGRINYNVESDVLEISKIWVNEWNDTVRIDYEYYYPSDSKYQDFVKLYDKTYIEEEIQEASIYATKLN